MNKLMLHAWRIDPRPVSAKTAHVLIFCGGVGLPTVVGLGLYNVSARVGHLPGASWILHTTFRNSASRRARTATMRAMVPQPPHIADGVRDWSAAELHWIVDEGVKMSGMPQWPADRLGKIWPVVAFLDRVRHGMTGPWHDRLVAPPATPARAEAGPVLSFCSGCHGRSGVSGNPHVPRLDILSQDYMSRGDRDSGIMEHAASAVPEADLARLAAIYADQTQAGGARPVTSLSRRGEAIATRGVAGWDVPACAACHGPWLEAPNPAYPALSGQYRPDLGAQSKLWRAGARGGAWVGRLMHRAAARLSDAVIAAVAEWYARRAPTPLAAGPAAPT